MKSTADKREREKRMVSEMIALYCRKKHHTKGGLCPECAELESYARMCRSGSLCQDEKRQVSVYGDENLLFQL